MKGTFRIDPAACRYGAATGAVRQILTEWMAIDWFVPPGPRAEVNATAMFEEHHRRARAYAPDLFAADLELRTVRGDLAGFADLCARVRSSSSGWDWKFSALKPLSSRHSKARGWSVNQWSLNAGVPSLQAGQVPGPGDLFVRLGDTAIWNSVDPTLDLTNALPKDHAEVANFYVSYAVMDAMECLEWQFAEPSADLLTDNPFLPLVRCYAAGCYPFALGPGTVVLFAFRRES